MDFKSYIRGLGAGIIIAVIICAVTAKHNNNLSEAEIRSMALEIGMVETQAFSNNRTESSQDSTAAADKSSEGTTEDNSQKANAGNTENTENEGTTESTETTEESKADAAKSSESTTDEAATNADGSKAEVTTDGEEINVVFKNMNYAYLASAALKSAGVIDDEQAFTDYIVEHGYARKVFDGEYTFTKGMSYEEIMKMICHIKDN